MKPAIKILTLLLTNKEERYTIKQIAERVNINYRIAYEKVIQLQHEKLIKITPSGNSKTSQLTYQFNPLLFQAEYERRQNLLKNKNFLVLQKRLSSLPFPFITLLFGSYAKGTTNKHSDIDLLTIGADKKELATTLSLWPEQIHLTSVTYAEFIHMAKSKEFTVVSEAIKNNIILIGIEEYYRLLEKCLIQIE